MARANKFKSRKQSARTSARDSKKLLIAAYGLVVMLSAGVLGGYLIFGKAGTAAPGTASLTLPPVTDNPGQLRSPTGEQLATRLVESDNSDATPVPDWDTGRQGLGDILLVPSSITAADLGGEEGPEAMNMPEQDIQTATLSDASRAFLPAWRRYAIAPPLVDGRPMIAIVIDDVGEDSEILDRLLAIDAPLTLSFFSWVDDVREKTARARAAGFELMVHVPMEPVLPKDPGPQALLDGLGLAENRRRLVWHLDQFEGFVGFNNHMGSLVTADTEMMTMVMNVVREQGLLFVDSRTTPRSIAGSIARRGGLPSTDRDVFIDFEDDDASIDKQLSILERKATRYGRATAIGHALPRTIDRLEKWIPKARERGLVIVPVSTIVRASIS